MVNRPAPAPKNERELQVSPTPAPRQGTVFQPVPANPLQRFGLYAGALYLFALTSQISLLVLPLAKLHLPAVLMTVSLLSAFATFALAPTPISRIGYLMAALTVIYGLAAVSGVWPGGSVTVLLNFWLRSLAVFVVLANLPLTMRDCTVLAAAFAGGVAFLSIYSLISAGEVQGRIIAEGTSFADPNDLALWILVALPIWAYLASRRSASIVFKACVYPLMLLMLLVILRTGSRGGLLALAAVAIFLFLQVKGIKRILIAGAVLVALVVAAFLVPPEARERYVTIFSSASSQYSDTSRIATESREGRIELLKRSIILSLRHPLLGVGPGMFTIAENEYAISLGARKGMWHETHNMYTQISSDAGLPALAIFLAILVLAFRLTGSPMRLGRSKPELQAAARLAFCARISLVAATTGGLFLSIAYIPLVPFLAGLLVSLERVAHAAVKKSCEEPVQSCGVDRKAGVRPGDDRK